MLLAGNKCVYKNCGKSKRNSPGLHLFGFPVKDPERCHQWIVNTGAATLSSMSEIELKRQKVCQDHFDRSAFMNVLKKRLIPSAIPISYEDLAADETETETEKAPLFEEVLIVTTPFEETPPSTSLYEDEPLILNRSKNTKTY